MLLSSDMLLQSWSLLTDWRTRGRSVRRLAGRRLARNLKCLGSKQLGILQNPKQGCVVIVVIIAVIVFTISTREWLIVDVTIVPICESGRSLHARQRAMDARRFGV